MILFLLIGKVRINPQQFKTINYLDMVIGEAKKKIILYHPSIDIYKSDHRNNVR